MAIVSISEAARLTSKNRKTIQRYVADGKLSLSHDAAGIKGIDTSELIRVFGELSHPSPAPQYASVSQAVQSTNVAPGAHPFEAERAALERVIEAQKGTIDVLEQQVDELTQEKRELRAQVAGLLEDRRKARPEPTSSSTVDTQAAKPSSSNALNWFYLGLVVAAGVFVAALVFAQHQ